MTRSPDRERRPAARCTRRPASPSHNAVSLPKTPVTHSAHLASYSDREADTPPLHAKASVHTTTISQRDRKISSTAASSSSTAKRIPDAATDAFPRQPHRRAAVHFSYVRTGLRIRGAACRATPWGAARCGQPGQPASSPGARGVRSRAGGGSRRHGWHQEGPARPWPFTSSGEKNIWPPAGRPRRPRRPRLA